MQLTEQRGVGVRTRQTHNRTVCGDESYQAIDYTDMALTIKLTNTCRQQRLNL